MNGKTKLALIGFALSCLVSFMFVLIYKHNNEKIKYLGNIYDYEILDVANSYEHIFIIDEYNIIENILNIHGCYIKLGNSINYVNNNYVLINNKNEIYGIKTLSIKRPSATEFFNDGFNYDNSGLHGYCKIYRFANEKELKIGVIIKEKNGNEYLIISNVIINGVR